MTKSKPSKPTSPSGGTTPCPPPCPPPDKWLADALAIMCPKDKAFLDDLRARGVTITAFDRIYYNDPYYDGTSWTTKPFEGGGSTSGTDMNIVTGGSSSQSVAETIYHEGIHTGQPNSMSWQEKEYDAYTRTEQWAIDHGSGPTRRGFRTTDSAGNPVPDTANIRSFVDRAYPIASESAPSGAVYNVVGRTPSGDTILQNTADASDTKTRPPKAGDTYAGPQIEEPPGGRPAQPCQLKCP